MSKRAIGSVAMSLLIITSMISGSIALGALTASASHGSGEVIVGPNGYSTIQEGINHANDSDTVVVREKNGNYSGSVRVNKSVNIVAEGDVIVDGEGNTGSAFIVNNSSQSLSNVSIVGFTIENVTRSSNDMTTGNGIYVAEDDLTNFTARQNDFSDISGSAVLIHGKASSSVSDVAVANNTMAGSVGTATQIYLTGQSTITNVTVAGNNATDVTTGLDIVALNDASVSDVNATLNRFTNSTTAIRAQAGGDGSANASVTNLDVSESALNKSETGVAVFSYGTSSITDVAVTEGDASTDGNNVSRTANGVAVEAYNSSSVADVLIRNASFEQSSTRAIGLTALDSSEISNVTISESAVNKTADGLVVAARDEGTVSDVTATNATFSNATGYSVLFDAADNGTISGISMNTVEARDVTHGLVAKARGSSTIQDINITEAEFTNESSAAFYFTAANQSSIENTSLSDARVNESEKGFLVSARNDSTIVDVAFDTVDASESAREGGHVYVTDNATVTGVDVSNVSGTNSSSGLRLQAGVTSSSTATLSDVSVSSSAFNNTENASYVATGVGNATLENVTVETVNATNTSMPGAVSLSDDASLTDLTVRETIGTDSDSGFVLTAKENASATDVLLDNNAFNETAGTGVTLYANKTAALTNVTVDTANVTNNDGPGVALTAIDQATVTDVNVTSVIAENTTNGFELATADNASVDGLTLLENGFNNTQNESYAISAVENVTLQDVTVDTVNASNTSMPGVVMLTDDASLTDLTVRETIGTNSDTGFALSVEDSASAQNVLLTDNAFNETDGVGAMLYANKTTTLHNVTVDTADASDNDGAGVAVEAVDNATVTDIEVTSVLADGSQRGFVLSTQDDVTVDGLTLSESGFNNTQNESYVLSGIENATLEDITVETVNASNTSVAGAVTLTDTATLTDLTVKETIAVDSDTGFFLSVEDSASAQNVLLEDNALNETADAGVTLYANKTTTLDNVTVDTADASDNAGAGVAVTAVDNASVTDLSMTTVSAENSDTGFRLAATDETVVKNLSLDENAFNNTRNESYRIDAVEDATLEDISVQTLNASNTTTAGTIALANNATLTDLSIGETIAVDSDTGFALHLQDDSAVSDVLLDGNAFNETAGTGVYLFANNSATLHNLTVDTAELSGNDDAAMALEAVGDAEVTDVEVTTVLAKDSGTGLAVMARNNASVEHLNLFENGFNNTAGTGVDLFANETATLHNVTIDTAEASDNDGPGLALTAGDNATVTEVNVTTVIAKGSATGFDLTARDDAVVEDLTLLENAFNDTQTDGVALTAKGSAVLRDVMVNTTEAGGTQIGLNVTAMDTAQVQNLTANTLRAEGTGAHGVKVQATSGTVTETPTITNVTLQRMLVNNSAGSAIQLETAGGGELTDVSVEEVLLNGNAEGIAIVATDESTVGPVRIKRALIENQSNVGIDIDIASSASHGRISVRESLLANNTNAGVQVSSSTDGADIDIHRSLIADNGDGVVNLNDSSLVDARYNYWGNSTGPSSGGASSTLQDPVYDNALANGAGDSVSEGATAGEANVRFAPAIGGKTISGNQLIDPVPEQQLNISIAGQTIEGPVSDFVGLTVWERSILPLRTDSTQAATSVFAPSVFLGTSGGDISLNRQNISVFTKGNSVRISFTKVSGADTTRFANDDAQLHILRVNSSVNSSVDSTADLFTTNVTDNGTITVETEGAEVVEVRDTQLDDTGELTTSFTPQQAGDYVALLTTTNVGDGFERTAAGGLSINAVNESVTIVGAEQIAVQTTPSTVTPSSTRVNPGEDVVFNADAEFDASNVTHVVVAYDKQRFTGKTIVVNTTNVLNETGTGTLVRINGTVDNEPFFVEATVENGSVTGFETGGSLEGVNSSVAVVRNGARTETLTLNVANISLTENESRTFRYVHAAVSEDGQKRSTNAGRLTVVRGNLTEVQLNLTANRSTVTANSPIKFTVTRPDGTPVANAQIAYDGSVAFTDSNGEAVVRPSSAGTVTAFASKPDTATETFLTDSVTFTVNRQTVQLSVSANRTTVTAGDPVRLTVTDSNGNRVAAQVSFGDTTLRTGSNGRVIIRPSSTGTITVEVTKQRTSAKEFLSTSIDITVEAEPSPGGGGGGGGGGQGGGDDGGEADVTETDDGATVNVRSTQSGQPLEVTLDGVSSDTSSLTSLSITTTFSESDFRVEVTRPQPDPPEATPRLPAEQGDDIEYFTATAIGITDDEIDRVNFTFTLDESDIPEGQSKEDVALFRYVDGEWVALETTHLGGDQYRAESPGFTAYAIGVQPAQEETATPTPTATATDTATATATDTATPTDTETATETQTPPAEDDGPPIAIIGILVVLLLLLGAGVYLYREA